MGEDDICSICNKKYDNYNYSYYISEYNKGSVEVCPECQKEKEKKSNYYFRNHLPNFVSGSIVTIIFNNKNELKEYLLSLNSDDCIIYVTPKIDNKSCEDFIMKKNTKSNQWWVLGYYYSKTKLDLPKFEDYYNKEI